MFQQIHTSPRVILDRNVRQLSDFVLHRFDPNCQQSWQKADRLYRAAVMARDVARPTAPEIVAHCRECDRRISAETAATNGGYCIAHASGNVWRDSDDYRA